ncbi:MAG: alpha/beta fold hydrolase [Acidimicrobiales bacterium]
MTWLLDDDLLDGFASRVLFHALYGGADFGEVRTTCDRVTAAFADGDDRLAAWHREWTATADRVDGIGDDAAAAGHPVSAREAHLRAVGYHRAAWSPFFGPTVSPELASSSAREWDALGKVAARWDPGVEVLTIPYEGTTLTALLVRATDDDTPRPTVVCTNGYDGTVGEMFVAHAMAATRRGYHCVVFDGPGQGRPLVDQGLHLRPDWERVVSPVLDVVVEHPAVDTDRVVLHGWSLGGFLAPRAAGGETRLAALVADPGQWDQRDNLLANLPLDDDQKAAFPDIDPAALDPMQQFLDDPAAPGALRWRMLQRGPLVHGTTTLLETLTALSQLTVSDVAGDIRCPTLLTAAEGDPTAAGAPKLLDAIGADTKQLVHFTDAEGAGGHCEGTARSLLHQRMYDWLDEVLAPR